MNKDQMHGACDSCEGKEVTDRALMRQSEGRRSLGKVDINGSIILEWILEECGWEDVDYLNLDLE
jgi:hypothetical protein